MYTYTCTKIYIHVVYTYLGLVCNYYSQTFHALHTCKLSKFSLTENFFSDLKVSSVTL